MTSYSSKCAVCNHHCDWIESPTGGWWIHREFTNQLRSDHPWPVIDWQPMEHLDDDGNWVTM